MVDVVVTLASLLIAALLKHLADRTDTPVELLLYGGHGRGVSIAADLPCSRTAPIAPTRPSGRRPPVEMLLNKVAMRLALASLLITAVLTHSSDHTDTPTRPLPPVLSNAASMVAMSSAQAPRQSRRTR